MTELTSALSKLPDDARETLIQTVNKDLDQETDPT